MYIDKLDDILNKYNNTYIAIKMKHVDVKSSTYNDSRKIINDKNPKFKIGNIVISSKYKKAIFQIGLRKFLLLQKLKILFNGHMLLVILKMKKLLRYFTKKNRIEIVKIFIENKSEKSLKLKKLLKEKAVNYMLNEKATIILSTVKLIKKTL